MNPVFTTPLSPQAKKVLMLGSGELGKEVVISLQRLGVEVHAADRYAHAPAMQVAHVAHVLDMTDAAALTKLIETIKPDLVVPEIEAIATQALVTLEAAGVQIIPTAEATLLTMNRRGIRTLAASELGLPTSEYRFADSLETLREACLELGFPCFVKPVMSSSGKGQSRLLSETDIDLAWEVASNGGRVKTTEVIVEAGIDFDYEITLLTVRAVGARGVVETHFCDPIGHRQEGGDYVESWQPMPMSEAALGEAQRIAKAVTDRIAGFGVFGVELFVKGDQVWFSEVSPRPHDTGLTTLATQFQSQFELHARAILGLAVDTTRHSVGASAVIKATQATQNPSFTGVQAALSTPGTDLRLFGKPEAHAGRRMGVVLARGDTTDLARQTATESASLIQVVSADSSR